MLNLRCVIPQMDTAMLYSYSTHPLVDDLWLTRQSEMNGFKEATDRR